MQNDTGFIISILVFYLGIGDGVSFHFLDFIFGDEAVAVGAETPCDRGRECAVITERVTEHFRHFDAAASRKLVVNFVETADVGGEALKCVDIRFKITNDRTVIGTQFIGTAACDVIGHEFEFHLAILLSDMI